MKINGAPEALLITDDPALDGRMLGRIECLTLNEPGKIATAVMRTTDTLQAGGVVFILAVLGNVIGGMVKANKLIDQLLIDRRLVVPDVDQHLVIVVGPDGCSTGLENRFRHVRVPDFQFADITPLGLILMRRPLRILEQVIKELRT